MGVLVGLLLPSFFVMWIRPVRRLPNKQRVDICGQGGTGVALVLVENQRSRLVYVACILYPCISNEVVSRDLSPVCLSASSSVEVLWFRLSVCPAVSFGESCL